MAPVYGTVAYLGQFIPADEGWHAGTFGIPGCFFADCQCICGVITICLAGLTKGGAQAFAACGAFWFFR